MYTKEVLSEMKMDQLREIGDAFEVKDTKKADLIDKILNAQNASDNDNLSIDIDDSVPKEDIVNAIDEIINETDEELFDGEPPIVKELWISNKELGIWPYEKDEDNNDWFMTTGIDLLNKGHSIGSFISAYCTQNQVKAKTNIKQSLYTRCNVLLREKRYSDMFSLIKETLNG